VHFTCFLKINEILYEALFEMPNVKGTGIKKAKQLLGIYWWDQVPK
jgi:hypothetical protein